MTCNYLLKYLAIHCVQRPQEHLLHSKLTTDGHVDYIPIQTLLDAGLVDLCAAKNFTTGASGGSTNAGGSGGRVLYDAVPKHCSPTEPTGIPLDQVPLHFWPLA